MTDYTEEEIDRLAKRVEEKIREKMMQQELFRVREDMRVIFDNIDAKLELCLAIFEGNREHLERGEDDT